MGAGSWWEEGGQEVCTRLDAIARELEGCQRELARIAEHLETSATAAADIEETTSAMLDVANEALAKVFAEPPPSGRRDP